MSARYLPSGWTGAAAAARAVKLQRSKVSRAGTVGWGLDRDGLRRFQ